MSYTVIQIKGGSEQLQPYANFIRTGFLNSLRRGNKWFKKLDQSTYYEVYGAIVDVLLKNPRLNFYIAVLTDEPDTALGWSLLEGRAIIYAFVKPEMRGNGIAQSLIPDNYRRKKDAH